MILTNVHAQFWLTKKGPDWVQKLNRAKAALNHPNHPWSPGPFHMIDSCVNAHAPRKLEFHDSHDVSNICNFLRSIRRHEGDLLAYLDKLTLNPGCLINPERRSAICRKWARKIRKNRLKQDKPLCLKQP